MSIFRVSIAGVIGLVALAALTLASMRSDSPWPLSVASTFTIGLILAALLGVFFLRDDARAFSAGFALFAGVFLLLVNWDLIGGQVGHDMTRGVEDLAERRIFVDPKKAGYFEVNILRRRQVIIGNFVQTVRLTASVGFGLIGGLIASAMASRTRRERTSPAEARSHE